MKIIAVNSSPRGTKSQTLRLLTAATNAAKKAGADVELVDLCKLKMEYCTGCEACHRTGTCTHHDDLVPLHKKLLAADGMIFAAPNYFRMVPAQMKTLIDRLSDVVHCQLFAGKYAASISTSGGPGCEEVTRYLTMILTSLGAFMVGSAAAAMSEGPDAMTAAEEKADLLGRELAAAIAMRRIYPDQQTVHQQTNAYFRRLVEFNKDRWAFEYELWKKKA